MQHKHTHKFPRLTCSWGTRIFVKCGLALVDAQTNRFYRLAKVVDFEFRKLQSFW